MCKQMLCLRGCIWLFSSFVTWLLSSFKHFAHEEDTFDMVLLNRLKFMIMLFVYFFVFIRLVSTWRGWWWIWCCRWDPRSPPGWEELLIMLLLCCAVNNHYWLHAIVEDQKCHVKRSKPTIGNKKLNVGFARKVQPTRQPKLKEGVVVVFRQIQRTKVSILLWSRFSRHITWICNAINIQLVLVDCR